MYYYTPFIMHVKKSLTRGSRFGALGMEKLIKWKLVRKSYNYPQSLRAIVTVSSTVFYQHFPLIF